MYDICFKGIRVSALVIKKGALSKYFRVAYEKIHSK